MKTNRYIFKILITISAVFVLFTTSRSLPQYELTIQHPMLIGGNTYQFDVYIKRLGSENFRIGNSQFITTFNSGQFTAPIISRITSSEQIGTGFFFDQEIVGNEIRITLGGNGSYLNASDISNISTGTRLSTYQITGVSVPILSPQLTWVNYTNIIRTGVSDIDAADNYFDITDITGASHINGGSEFAQISGFKFDDLNGNSAWDQPAEPALNGWTITLTGPNGTLTANTGDGTWGTGYYEFVNLTPSVYNISETSQANWSQTSAPINPISVKSGDNLQNMNFGNYNGPAVLGLVFNDNDGSGTKDNAEGGLAGWLVLADKVGGGGSKSATTNSNGDYAFVFSPSESGLWVISQMPQTGWIQTFPSAPLTYTIDIQSGTYETGKNFGNFRTCSISGMKFNDYNRDSVKQTFEPGISNWKIRLIKNGTQIDSVRTDASGNYTFSNLTVGNYTVTEEHNSGWAQTYPAPPGVHNVSFNSGGINEIDKNFGNYHIIPVGGIGQISGKLFEDMNGNGILEPGDNGLQGWKVRLFVGSTVVDSQMTNSTGDYLFQDLDDGIYTVSEECQSNWHQTLPASSGSYSITIGINQRVFTGNDFGSFLPGTISGMVYHDVNHNGHHDVSEPGMAGIQINLSGSLGSQQFVTLAGGSWTFNELSAGTYTITEELPLGYHLTEPIDEQYIINIGSGSNISNLKFGTSVSTDTVQFRTFGYDSLFSSRDARGRISSAIKKKADKVEFRAVFRNTTGSPIYGIHLYFSPALYLNDALHPLNVAPTPSQITFAPAPKNAIMDIIWADSIHANDSVVITGWGLRGKYENITYAWLINHGGKKLKPTFTLNQPRLPLPNVVNVRDEIFKLNGFSNEGLVVGVPDPPHQKVVGWVRMKAINDVQQSTIYRSTTHTVMGKGFDNFENGNDFIKEQKKLSPFKHNNRLFADVMTLKLNIKASEMEIIPAGLGELVFDDGINPLSGLTIRKLADTADQALTYWQYLQSSYFTHLDTTIKKVLKAFEGPVDTESFATQLKLKGTKKLIEVPYLRAIAGVKPVIVKGDKISSEYIPDKFELCQNYPNPFNPVTSIRIAIPAYGKVSLKIYNVLGQEVSTLMDNVTVEEGVENILFDASNLPSGVYFARSIFQQMDEEELSTSPEEIQVMKMILIR